MDTRNDFFESRVKTEKSIKCEKCSKIFPYDSKEFYTVYGDISQGVGKKMLGNNFDVNGFLNGATTICETCLLNSLDIKVTTTRSC